MDLYDRLFIAVMFILLCIALVIQNNRITQLEQIVPKVTYATNQTGVVTRLIEQSFK